jgi:hypothetical protein
LGVATRRASPLSVARESHRIAVARQRADGARRDVRAGHRPARCDLARKKSVAMREFVLQKNQECVQLLPKTGCWRVRWSVAGRVCLAVDVVRVNRSRGSRHTLDQRKDVTIGKSVSCHGRGAKWQGTWGLGPGATPTLDNSPDLLRRTYRGQEESCQEGCSEEEGRQEEEEVALLAAGPADPARRRRTTRFA